MGALTLQPSTPDLQQAILYTLLDVFDAARDLYQTLAIKERRDNARAKGYVSSRNVELVDDAEDNGTRGILTDKLAVLKRYEDGLRVVGEEVAIGDALSHVSLQSEVIKLQEVLLKTFLYGPTSSEPLSRQLEKIDDASRAAATAAVDVLNAFQQRCGRNGSFPGSRRGSVHMPGGFEEDEEQSTAMVAYRDPPRLRPGSPVNTTIITKHSRTETPPNGTRSLASHHVTPSPPSETQGLYCPYALTLDNHRNQSLSRSITHPPSTSPPSCPTCARTFRLSPTKTWEILKSDTGHPRCFRLSTRFIVKCHRPGPDAGYACILCSRADEDVTVCGDVKALVKHVCEDHGSRELKGEEDVVEVVEVGVGEKERERDGEGRSAWEVASGRGRSKSECGSRKGRRRGESRFERDNGRWEGR